MSRIFSFWSVDGGVGKTTMSTNIALRTAMNNPEKKIVLLDFNLFNPDIDLHLGLEQQDLKYMLDYFTRNEINFKNIEESLIQYKNQKNLYILTGLYDITYFDKIKMEHFTLLLEYLKKMNFDYIFIDVNSSLNIDATFVSLVSCNKLIFIGKPDYPCIRNMSRYIDEALKRLYIKDEQIEIIINCFDNSLITKEEIYQVFGRNDICFIDYDKNIIKGVNKSKPFVTINSRNMKKINDELDKFIIKITTE